MHSIGTRSLCRATVLMRRALDGLARRLHSRVDDATGQTTAEYALVILGAAAVGTLLITWATKSHTIGKLFDEVVGKILT